MEKEKIVELFPGINSINNEELKEKVINTIKEAVEKGGWEYSDLKNIPFTLLIENCEVSLIDHTNAVLEVAVKIGETFQKFYPDLEIDMDYLISAAVLHDVGKFLEYTKQGDKIVKSKNGKYLRHPFTGMALAYKNGLPEEICHCIGGHSKEGDHAPRSKLSVIINHADFVNFHTLKATF